LALQQAGTAIESIKGLMPRLAAVGSLFDEIETLIRSGRERIGVSTGAAAPVEFPRPTLVVPAPSAASPVLQAPPAPEPPNAPEPAPAFPPVDEPGLITFRLEFESNNGSLDLRTVDDAVSEHPAVRDVALLDYDGRRAVLKVWIVGNASPSHVQDALQERAGQLFGTPDGVRIVALEDAA
jgi:hypothetical protein